MSCRQQQLKRIEMDKLKISTAQFENKSGDKSYNLSVIDKLSDKAANEGSNCDWSLTA